jgi:ABC-type multidrug transport system fused ATPase/permease subunit
MDENEADVQGAESGRIMNLMNGDCYSVAQWFWEVSVIIRAPIELLAGVFFLYQILGWSSLVGLATVILPIVVLRSLSIRNMALQRALLASTDRRIAVISELVGAIRFLKYYAWEKVS